MMDYQLVRRRTHRAILFKGRLRRHRSERGAVMVEAAIVLPLMIFIVVGIMEFGLLFTSYSTTTASTRSGARLAATQYSQAQVGPSETPSQTAALAQISLATEADLKVLNNAKPIGMAIYKVNPNSASGAPYGGFPAAGMSGGCTSSCVKYKWNGTAMVRTGGSWSNPQRCVISSVDSIGVYVQVEHSYITGLIGSKRTVEGHTVMRLEPVPSESC